MTDLSTHYLGLKLKNPIVAASSGLTKDISGIRKLAENNIGAIVLKSLFEEQILFDANQTLDKNLTQYTEATEYVSNYIKDNTIGDYLSLIENAKKETDVPIIASINCISSSEWVSFASKIESAGADALELNVSMLPFDEDATCDENEKIYFQIIEEIKRSINIPLSLKMGYYSSGLAKLLKRISWTGDVEGITLFNRYYSPDIDINELKISASNIFSSPSDITLPLRWTALLSGDLECDIAATTGIHSGEGVIKMLLAGATVVHVASALYKHGPSHIMSMLQELEQWMQKNNYSSIDDFKGKMSQAVTGLKHFERVQFMKYYSGHE